LLVIPGSTLNATISYLSERTPFNPMLVLSDEYRCITLDLTKANSGGSSGPVQVDRPWDSYADDQFGLMNHLEVDKFMVLGFCIAAPSSGPGPFLSE
jgi:pimeloyl-ACP methyl ester carboxylesterase